MGMAGGAAFIPTDIASLAYWFDASSGTYQDSARTTPATADSDPVGGWEDLSGQARHLAQGTAGLRPTLRTAVLNGRSVLRFDGADDFLRKTFGANLPSQATVFVVGKNTANGGILHDGDDVAHRHQVYRRAAGTYAMFAGALLEGPAADSNFHLFTAKFASVSSVFRLDRAQVAAGDAGAEVMDALTVGAAFDNSSTVSGDIAAVLGYAAALTASEIERVEDYLAARYGL